MAEIYRTLWDYNNTRIPSAVLRAQHAACGIRQAVCVSRIKHSQNRCLKKSVLDKIMYANGDGVPEDKAEAVNWYRLAAEQDFVEAVAWFRKAAEQGDADAQARMEQRTPTPASDAASLFQAQSVRCEWGQGTIVSWDEGRPVLEQGNFGKDAGIVFDSIDTQAGTARIIGNAAAGDIRVVETPDGLTFIEQATFGGLNFTTVFAHFVGPGNVALAAVTSRHLSFASPFPSQYHGTCVILQ